MGAWGCPRVTWAKVLSLRKELRDRKVHLNNQQYKRISDNIREYFKHSSSSKSILSKKTKFWNPYHYLCTFVKPKIKIIAQNKHDLAGPMCSQEIHMLSSTFEGSLEEPEQGRSKTPEPCKTEYVWEKSLSNSKPIRLPHSLPREECSAGYHSESERP